MKLTPQQHAEIRTVRHHQDQHPQLKKQTVFEFKVSYQKQKRDAGKDGEKVATKKPGRYKLLAEKVLEKAITFINTLLLNGSPVNVNVINIIAKGIVMASDCILLAEHGCFLSFSKQYGRKTLIEVARIEGKMMRRIATTSKVPISPWLLREKKYTFKKKNKQISNLVEHTSWSCLKF